jgi:molybdenum cofactor cytidylyltransferase
MKSQENTASRVFGLILAAGQSRRMGQPKQLLKFGDSTLIETVISNATHSNLDGLVAVVNPAIAQSLGDRTDESCDLAVNSNPESQMIESVQLGIHHIADCFAPSPRDGNLILLGDQPQVTTEIIDRCLDAFRSLPDKGIVIATYAGHRGHPTIFSFKLISEILTWGGDRRLNELAELHASRVRELALPGAAPVDVNTPDDYRDLSAR